LKRESRREARAAKEEAEAEGVRLKKAIKAAIRGALEEGFPTDVEEKETYFMSEISRGEALCQDGEFCSLILR
jgi:mitochondrial import receptor subunit TOM20